MFELLKIFNLISSIMRFFLFLNMIKAICPFYPDSYQFSSVCTFVLIKRYNSWKINQTI